jgi:hypothetical protein
LSALNCSYVGLPTLIDLTTPSGLFHTITGYTARGILDDTFTPLTVDFLCNVAVRDWSLEKLLEHTFTWEALCASGVIIFRQGDMDGLVLCAELRVKNMPLWGLPEPIACINPGCKTQGRRISNNIRAAVKNFARFTLCCQTCGSHTNRVNQPRTFRYVDVDVNLDDRKRMWRPQLWEKDLLFSWFVTPRDYSPVVSEKGVLDRAHALAAIEAEKTALIREAKKRRKM